MESLREKAEEKLKKLEESRLQLLANLNAHEGAIGELKALLKEEDKEVVKTDD